MKPALGLDIDGVLVDFTFGWSQLAARLFDLDRRPQSGGARRVWGFEDDGWMTKKQVDELWRAVDASHTFWQSLEPLVTHGEVEMLHDATDEFSIVYVTSRVDKLTVREQTEVWLRRHGFPAGELTLVHDKAPLLTELHEERGLVAFLDDAPRNIMEISEAGLQVVIRDWPYNRHLYGPRVGSVAEYLWLADHELRPDGR